LRGDELSKKASLNKAQEQHRRHNNTRLVEKGIFLWVGTVSSLLRRGYAAAT